MEIVDFSSFSNAMKDAKVRWLRRGEPVAKTSLTATLAGDRSQVFRSQRKSGEVDLMDWFDCPRSHIVTEDVIGLGKSGKTLTVIHSRRLTQIQEGLDDDDVDEERLVESWTPRFRR